jgi:septal ring factor EnvC (AmiA/AmiB activator)
MSAAGRYSFLWLLLLLLSNHCLLAQQSSTSDLRRQRQQLERDIRRNQQRLNETRREKQAALSQLSLLDRQIGKRRQLIRLLREEVEQIDGYVVAVEDTIRTQQAYIDQLRQEYARTLRTAYRAYQTQSWLNFLYTSNSVNDAIRRWLYFRQYQRHRRRQSRDIEIAQQAVQKRMGEQQLRKAEKERLLSDNEKQRAALSSERSRHNDLVGKLNSNEKDILASIRRQQRETRTLNSAITNAINQELAIQNRSNTGTGGTNRREEPGPGTSTSPASNQLTVSFAAQRGKLPWPVASGQILSRYGRQPHPSVPNIMISNNGIKITVAAASPVRCVFNGEIVNIQTVPGSRQMILVKHGEYFTVYSNLENVEVVKRQQVKSGDILGVAAGGENPLHFELWKGSASQDPEKWITRQ